MKRPRTYVLSTLVFAACGTVALAEPQAHRRTPGDAPAATQSAPAQPARSPEMAVPREAAPPAPAASSVTYTRSSQPRFAENESGQSDSSGRSRVPRTGGSSGGGSSSGGSGGGRSTASGSSGRGSSGSAGDSGRTAQPRQRYPNRSGDGSYYAGHAVPRGSVGYRPPVYYHPPYHPWYGSWYPWGFGSWGLGFYFWDPYYYGGWGYNPYSYGYGYAGGSYQTGGVRLLIKPRDAQVFVDGYYVGVVDEFDGTFQKLTLEEGPHRIEIRKDGFQTLSFDVRVTWDHTIKLRGELTPAAP